MRLSLINILLVWGVSLLFFVSCEQQTDWDLQKGAPLLVVEGIITDELQPYTITLSESVSSVNEEFVPISGAEVTISAGNQDFTLIENSTIPGTYSTTTSQRAVINRKYTLHIRINGKEYTAQAKMIPITESDNMSYYRVSSDTSKYAVSQNISTNENAMWRIDYDWNFAGNCDTCNAKQYLYSLQSLDVAQVFSTGLQNITVPLGTNIRRTKYSLEQSHADYIRQILLETRWNGGYFDENPAQVQGNISNGGMGYFGVCSVLKDSVVIED